MTYNFISLRKLGTAVPTRGKVRKTNPSLDYAGLDPLGTAEVSGAKREQGPPERFELTHSSSRATVCSYGSPNHSS